MKVLRAPLCGDGPVRRAKSMSPAFRFTSETECAAADLSGDTRTVIATGRSAETGETTRGALATFIRRARPDLRKDSQSRPPPKTEISMHDRTTMPRLLSAALCG